MNLMFSYLQGFPWYFQAELAHGFRKPISPLNLHLQPACSSWSPVLRDIFPLFLAIWFWVWLSRIFYITYQHFFFFLFLITSNCYALITSITLGSLQTSVSSFLFNSFLPMDEFKLICFVCLSIERLQRVEQNWYGIMFFNSDSSSCLS